MAIVTTIAGLRAIADRSGTYRPDDQPARIVYDEAARHPKANPHGIVECLVTPYRFAHRAWHPVVGQVYWEEIAPIREKGGAIIHVNECLPEPVDLAFIGPSIATHVEDRMPSGSAEFLINAEADSAMIKK